LILGGCGGTGAPKITTQPSSQTVGQGQTATFEVAAVAGSGSLAYQWQKGGVAISGATTASYVTPAAAASDSGSQFRVIVSDSRESLVSRVATLTVNPPTDVLTQHNDNARTGQNLTETILTAANVNSAQFGKVGFYAVDGLVDAEPLYASNVAVPKQGAHNLLIVATENGSVYAFDADSGATIWQTTTLKSGETAAPDPSYPGLPQIGVNATPVIDRSSGPNGAIYVVASSAQTENGVRTYYQRLHALDLALGTELFAGPVDIQATFPGTGDNSDGTNVIFDPGQYRERVGLLLLNGVVYTAWASHFDVRPYTGWIIGYNEATLQQTSVLDITPNGTEGAIWMSGAGLAADSSGYIYLLDANGTFDATLNSAGFPSQGDYGNAFLKLSTANDRLAVADYFEMNNGIEESDNDTDLGSGGAMILPDMTDAFGRTVHLAIGAGKDNNLYVVNRDSVGKFSANDRNVYQKLPGVLPNGIWAMPAYFNNAVYYGSTLSSIRAFAIANGKLSSTAFAQTSNTFEYPGATPSVSANGTSEGIVWAVENTNPAVLHAYNAANLTELYNSSQASNERDQFGNGNKFITPMIANGKVFVGTPNGVAVFGVLP
jgi:hypothetical protein